MRNKYPGTCYRCGKIVQANAGHFELIPGKQRADARKWRFQHADCAIKFRGTQHEFVIDTTKPKPDGKLATPALTGYAYIVEPFDFECDGDHARLIPDQNYRPPAWLALPTDDPAWMPEQYHSR